MELPLFSDLGEYQCSDTDIGDVVVFHEYCEMYQYECGRSFVEICKDLGLDKKDDIQISLL